MMPLSPRRRLHRQPSARRHHRTGTLVCEPRRGGEEARLLPSCSVGPVMVPSLSAGQTMPTVPCLLCRNIIWVIIWPFFVFAVSHLLCTASSPPYFISYSVYWIIRANPATCRSPDEGAIEPSTGLTRERCHFLTFSIYLGHRAGTRILGILAGRIGSTGSNIGRLA